MKATVAIKQLRELVRRKQSDNGRANDASGIHGIGQRKRGAGSILLPETKTRRTVTSATNGNVSLTFNFHQHLLEKVHLKYQFLPFF